MEVRNVPTSDLKPNPWNPNEMPDRAYNALKQNLAQGLHQNLLARKHPSGSGYDIIDGYHRWKAAAELNIPELPVQVIEADEAEARILTIQLNKERGELNPRKLAENLEWLASKKTLEEVQQRLAITPLEYDLYLATLGRQEYDFTPERTNLHHANFFLNDEQEKTLQAALDKTKLADRALAITAIAKHYLEGNP